MDQTRRFQLVLVLYLLLVLLLLSLLYWTQQSTSVTSNAKSSREEEIIRVESESAKPKKSIFTKYPDDIQLHICSDPRVLNSIQINQWLRAVMETFEGTAYLHINDKDMGFYHGQYGGIGFDLRAVESNTSHNDDPQSFLYFKIPNIAEEVVQSLLVEYAFLRSGHLAYLRFIPCLKYKNCAHRDLKFLSAQALIKHLETRPGKRINLIVTREPIERFLSTYSQMEILQAKLSKKRANQLIPLKQPRKSVARFIEFVNYLLLKGPSIGTIKQHERIGSAMLVSQVGTLAKFFEQHNDANNYVIRFETFQEDWQLFCQKMGLHDLSELSSHRRKDYYDEHLDGNINRSSSVASMFLGSIDDDARTRFTPLPRLTNGKIFSEVDRKLATKYLLALCRIYLPDYICGNYLLPPHCQGLMEEVRRDLHQLTN